MSMAIPFDYYIFDTFFEIGDPDFKKTCAQILSARLQTSRAIVFTTRPEIVRQFSCIYVYGSEGVAHFDAPKKAFVYFKTHALK